MLQLAYQYCTDELARTDVLVPYFRKTESDFSRKLPDNFQKGGIARFWLHHLDPFP
jgi:hypothetical protein